MGVDTFGDLRFSRFPGFGLVRFEVTNGRESRQPSLRIRRDFERSLAIRLRFLTLIVSKASYIRVCIKSLRSAVSALDLCDDSRKADASSCASNPESRKSRLCEKEIRRTASSILSEISFSPREANTLPREGRYCALSSTSPICPAIVSVGPTGFPFTSTYDPEGKVTVAVS